LKTIDKELLAEAYRRIILTEGSPGEESFSIARLVIDRYPSADQRAEGRNGFYELLQQSLAVNFHEIANFTEYFIYLPGDIKYGVSDPMKITPFTVLLLRKDSIGYKNPTSSPDHIGWHISINISRFQYLSGPVPDREFKDISKITNINDNDIRYVDGQRDNRYHDHPGGVHDGGERLGQEGSIAVYSNPSVRGGTYYRAFPNN